MSKFVTIKDGYATYNGLTFPLKDLTNKPDYTKIFLPESKTKTIVLPPDSRRKTEYKFSFHPMHVTKVLYYTDYSSVVQMFTWDATPSNLSGIWPSFNTKEYPPPKELPKECLEFLESLMEHVRVGIPDDPESDPGV